MMPGSGEDEVMQIQEVLIILGKENIALADSIREMLGVRDPRVPTAAGSSTTWPIRCNWATTRRSVILSSK